MGMDLIPRLRVVDPLHYNWSGWRGLVQFLDKLGVDTFEFDGCNDGHSICAASCRKIADAIEAGRDKYNKMFAGESYGPDPATEHAKQWRESRGMRQF